MEFFFTELNTLSYVYFIRGMKTFVAFMIWTVPNENTFGCAKIKFVLIIGSEMGVAGTSKTLRKSICGFV